ncbi:MAG: hypothetical protein JRD89_09385 [Deltaproteobacteria bacterium]|nr:hypothetical protein [Deltaproteobacteria bacterium]
MAELYHDVDIVERTEITREGKVEKVYRITASTVSGVHFTLDIDEADFTKAKVHELLSKKAAQIEDIKAL